MAIKPKKVKRTPKERRRMRVRKSVVATGRPRLSVHKSSQHIYAQVISDVDGRTLAAASTREKSVMERIASLPEEGFINGSKSTKSMRAAKAVGLIVADRAKQHDVTKVVFDRGAHPYHGRVQAVADGAREGGLDF